MRQGVSLSDMDLKGLFIKHASTLRGYLARKVRDPQLAADLVQESFLRMAEHGRKHTIDNSPATSTARRATCWWITFVRKPDAKQTQ